MTTCRASGGAFSSSGSASGRSGRSAAMRGEAPTRNGASASVATAIATKSSSRAGERSPSGCPARASTNENSPTAASARAARAAVRGAAAANRATPPSATATWRTTPAGPTAPAADAGASAGSKRRSGTSARSWKRDTARKRCPCGAASSSRAASAGRTTAVEESETRRPAKTAGPQASPKAGRASARPPAQRPIWSAPASAEVFARRRSLASGNSSPTKKRMRATPKSAMASTCSVSRRNESACGPMSAPVARNPTIAGSLSFRKRKRIGSDAARTIVRSRSRSCMDVPPLEPVAQLVREALPQLRQKRTARVRLEVDLHAALPLLGDEVGDEARDRAVVHVEVELEVVEEAARIEVRGADDRDLAVEDRDLRVDHPVLPLEDARARPQEAPVRGARGGAHPRLVDRARHDDDDRQTVGRRAPASAQDAPSRYEVGSREEDLRTRRADQHAVEAAHRVLVPTPPAAHHLHRHVRLQLARRQESGARLARGRQALARLLVPDVSEVEREVSHDRSGDAEPDVDEAPRVRALGVRDGPVRASDGRDRVVGDDGLAVGPVVRIRPDAPRGDRMEDVYERALRLQAVDVLRAGPGSDRVVGDAYRHAAGERGAHELDETLTDDVVGPEVDLHVERPLGSADRLSPRLEKSAAVAVEGRDVAFAEGCVLLPRERQEALAPDPHPVRLAAERPGQACALHRARLSRGTARNAPIDEPAPARDAAVPEVAAGGEKAARAGPPRGERLGGEVGGLDDEPL